LFDLDDTLVPERDAWVQAFNEACANHASSLGVGFEELRRKVFETSRVLWATSEVSAYCARVGLGSPSSLLSSYPGNRAEDEVLRGWGPSYRHSAWVHGLRDAGIADPSLASTLEPAFRASFQTVHRPYDDVAETLHQLGRARVGVLTNGFADLQYLKLERSGLLDQIEILVVSGEVGIGKPDPRIFEIALQDLSVEPEECLMVGDSLDRDVRGASAVGIKSVLLSRDGRKGEWAGPVIKTLVELLPFLDS